MSEKYLSLDELLASGQPIFVKNATSKPSGTIHLSIVDPSSGKRYPLNIPKTWIPICLNDRLSKSMIEGSFDLRQCIANGALKLVDSEEALKMMQEPDAKAELERVSRSVHTEKQLVENTSNSKNIASNLNALNEQNKAKQRNTDSNQNNDNSQTASRGPRDTFDENPEDSVNQQIVSIVLELENDTTTIHDAVSRLRSIEDELNEADYAYIINHVGDSQFKSYAKKKLSAIRGETSAE